MNLSIRPEGIGNTTEALTMQNQQMQRIRTGIDTVRKSNLFSGQARVNLQGMINSLLRQVEQEERILWKMSQQLGTIQRIYISAEQKAVSGYSRTDVDWNDILVRGEAIDFRPIGPSHGEKTNPFAWEWKDTWSLFSSFGILGKLVSGVGMNITETDNMKKFLSSAKFVNTFIGGTASAFSSSVTAGDWMRHLFGFNSGIKDIVQGDGFIEAMESSLHKQFWKDLGFEGAPNTADKVQVATKWGGHVLTLAGNAYENYQEMKSGEIGLERMLNETVVETGVDIGLSAVTTAALTAAAAAVGFAAPVAVIGGVAVGVIWAANGICKWATGGRDIGEVVADTVCDIGEAAVQVRNAVVDSAVSAVQSVWSGLCSVFA